MCHSLFHLWNQNSFPDVCRRILQRNPSHPWQYFPVAGLFNSALYTFSLLLWPDLSILSMTYPPQHDPKGSYGPSHALWQSGWLVGFLHFSCIHTPHTLCISYLSLSNTLSGLKQHLCHPVFVGKELSVIRWIFSGSGTSWCWSPAAGQACSPIWGLAWGRSASMTTHLATGWPYAFADCWSEASSPCHLGPSIGSVQHGSWFLSVFCSLEAHQRSHPQSRERVTQDRNTRR